ncbi:MAG: NAD(P)-dependent oxidoreductase [Candidatus Dojkabacteria bacterium]|nr:MAG: NAD(P)-dependent oxidoreductase [Candidatus Dojkabacteria bacterium]
MEMVELVTLLRKQKTVTVYQLMESFGFKRTAARHHLRKAIAEGIVKTSKKGRVRVYYLAEEAVVTAYFLRKITQYKQGLNKILESSHHARSHAGKGKKSLAIVNYFDLLPDARRKLEEYYEISDYSHTQLYVPDDEFVKRAKHSQVIINNYAGKVTETLLKQLPQLEYMHLTTHMYRYVDIVAMKERNLHLSNIPYDYKSTAVTEYVLSQTFALLRATVEAAAQASTGVTEFRYFKGEQLRGKKVIIFGTELGTEDLVVLLRGLGVEIGIYTEDLSVDPTRFGVSRFATEEEIFETGDIYYFSWTGDEYKDLVGKLDHRFLSKLTRPVYLISVYKHQYIDYQGVREKMYQGLIKGLAFDYYPELQEGSLTEARKLMHLPNVLITPDIGWYTSDSVRKMNEYTVQRLVSYAQGKSDLLLF